MKSVLRERQVQGEDVARRQQGVKVGVVDAVLARGCMRDGFYD